MDLSIVYSIMLPLRSKSKNKVSMYGTPEPSYIRVPHGISAIRHWHLDSIPATVSRGMFPPACRKMKRLRGAGFEGEENFFGTPCPEDCA